MIIKQLLILSQILLVFFLVVNEYPAEGHLRERFFFRRQLATNGESEKESTTSSTPNTGSASQAPPQRLYPDIAHLPEANHQQHQPNHHNGPPTPFIPSFGFPQTPQQNQMFNYIHVPGSPYHPMRQPAINQHQMTPSERQQSLTFTNGLGARLLAMIGIKSNNNLDDNKSNEGKVERSDSSQPTTTPTLMNLDDTMKALQNSSVLSQLNKGVHTIYGSLSRMYNTTVQQQLNLLQERFNKGTENSTSNWQQRMAKQVPEYFKHVANRLNEAQENLNKVIRQVGMTMNNVSALEANENQHQQSRAGHFFEHFADPNFNGESFFSDQNHQVRGGEPVDSTGQQLVRRMRSFWYEQVQPQIGNIRGQVNRLWRDLSSNGMIMYNDVLRNVNGHQNKNNSSAGSDLVDDILKSVDINGSDFVVLDKSNVATPNDQDTAGSEPKSEKLQLDPQQQQQQQQPQGSNTATNRTMQMLAQSQQMIQNGLMNAQRELNQLWGALSNSLQSTMTRVEAMLNPQQQRPQFFVMPNGQVARNQEPAMLPNADVAENEIDGRLKELSKLQKDADNVYETVRRKQQEQDQQQRSGFALGDNFRNFFSQFNQQIEHFPARFEDSVNRFGTAVGDFWHQIPTRWNNFMENMRQPQAIQANNRQQASSTQSSQNVA